MVHWTAPSSQGGVIVFIHLQVFLLLLVALGFVGRCTVGVIVFILSVKLVLCLVPAESSAATAPRGTTSASLVATTTATTTTTVATGLILGFILYVVALLLLVGHFVQLLDLFLQLGSAVVLIPLLPLINFLHTVIQVLVDDGGRNAEQGELLDDHQIKIEGLLVLDGTLRLLSLLVLLASDMDHAGGLSLSLGLSHLHFAGGELLVDLLLDDFLRSGSLSLSRNLLIVHEQTSLLLKGAQVAGEVVTAVELFLVRMRHRLNHLLALSLAFLLVCASVENLVLLSLHPLDVHDFFALLLEVEATLPVGLTLLVLLGVELVQLLIDYLDQLLNCVELAASHVLLSVRCLKLFPDFFHLLVKHFLLGLNFFDLAVDLILLGGEALDLEIDLTEASSLGNGGLKYLDFFAKLCLSLCTHSRRR